MSPDLATATSKRALKRQLKRQRWEATRQQRRDAEKLKAKLRIKTTHEAVERGELERTALDGLRTTFLRRQLKASTMKDSRCEISIVIDMSFAHLMTDHEAAKCCKQLLRCYSLNRRLDNPVQLHMTSIDNINSHLSRHSGWEMWDVHWHSENYLTALTSNAWSDKIPNRERIKKICYLTSESDNVLDGPLDAGCAYIIGGIVDHNRLVGLTHQALCSVGNSLVTHARLPIDRFMDIKSRHVLTIDQVFDILSQLAQMSNEKRDSKKDWLDVLSRVLPARKLSPKERQK